MSTFRARVVTALRHMPSRGRFAVLAALLTVGLVAGAPAPSANAVEYPEIRATMVNDAANSNTSTIQLNGTVAGDQYEAFRLLDATTAGENVAYTTNSKYESLLRSAIAELGGTAVHTSAQIVAWIAALPNKANSAGQSVTLEQFAATVYKYIYIESGKYASDATAEHKGGSVTFSVPQGYYLFHQTANNPDSGRTDSAFILDTAGNGAVSVNAKNETVSLTKKVKDDDVNGNANTVLGMDGYTEQWLDAADFGAGERFTFQLTGTLPANYDEFSTFKYVFHDEPAKGLDIQVNDDTNTIHVYVDNNGARTDVTKSFAFPKTIQQETDKFTVGIDNLKTLKSVNAKSKIVLEYDAKLNTSSQGIGIGSKGNPNKARVEFSTSPYGTSAAAKDGAATTFTPYDLATVFTYQLSIAKTFSGGVPSTLPTFTLYELESDGQYAKVGSNTVKDSHRATFVGVDEGRYKLVESNVPAGFNKADDIYFTVAATHDVEGADPGLTFLQTTLTNAQGDALRDKDGEALGWAVGQPGQKLDGVISGTVENVAGTELPSTGGNGVNMFYWAGGLLVALAVAGLTRVLRNRP